MSTIWSERAKFELDRKEDPLDWRFVSSNLVNSSVTAYFDLVLSYLCPLFKLVYMGMLLGGFFVRDVMN